MLTSNWKTSKSNRKYVSPGVPGITALQLKCFIISISLQIQQLCASYLREHLWLLSLAERASLTGFALKKPDRFFGTLEHFVTPIFSGTSISYRFRFGKNLRGFFPTMINVCFRDSVRVLVINFFHECSSFLSVKHDYRSNGRCIVVTKVSLYTMHCKDSANNRKSLVRLEHIQNACGVEGKTFQKRNFPN